MTSETSIFEYLPRTIENTVYEVDEEHTYSVDTQTYRLDRSPIVTVTRVVAIVNGSSTVLEAGTDYSVVDANGDGDADSIQFDVSARTPDADTTFTVEYTIVPVISRYTGAYDEEASVTVDRAIEAAQSHLVSEASGRDLDEIGKIFGLLGERRGRDDESYRQYLRSLVPSFSGRGTVSGIEFAIRAALDVPAGRISVVDHFSRNEYSVVLTQPWPRHRNALLSEVAELSDPAAIDLYHIVYDIDIDALGTDDTVLTTVINTNTWNGGTWTASTWT